MDGFKSSMILLGLLVCSIADAVKIKVLEDKEFQGDSTFLEIKGCVNVPAAWNDRISSINTQGHCVKAYEDGNCKGKSVRIAPGTPSHDNLVDLAFNDMISSFRPCGSGNSGSGGHHNNHPGDHSSGSGDWRKLSLDSHNLYRAKHGVPPLSLSDDVNKSAQKCAEYLAANKIFDHVCSDKLGHKYGENLYMRSDGDVKMAALAAVKGWYETEESKHNYNSNIFQHPSGHFSQMVWKSSRRLGMGFAVNGDFKVVVAHYDPPGNVKGQFIDNVPRPK